MNRVDDWAVNILKQLEKCWKWMCTRTFLDHKPDILINQCFNPLNSFYITSFSLYWCHRFHHLPNSNSGIYISNFLRIWKWWISRAQRSNCWNFILVFFRLLQAELQQIAKSMKKKDTNFTLLLMFLSLLHMQTFCRSQLALRFI